MRKSVLYVEDLTLQQRLFKMLYGKEYDITTVYTAEEALELLKTHTYDAVVTDMHLGMGMTGADLVLMVRKLYPDMKIHVLTADQNTKVSGAKMHYKPFEMRNVTFA